MDLEQEMKIKRWRLAPVMLRESQKERKIVHSHSSKDLRPTNQRELFVSLCILFIHVYRERTAEGFWHCEKT